MSAGQILIISGMTAAFVLFALALAWGDLQYQRYRREKGQDGWGSPETATAQPPVEHRKAA